LSVPVYGPQMPSNVLFKIALPRAGPQVLGKLANTNIRVKLLEDFIEKSVGK